VLLQSRVGQARFEWSKVRRRLDSFHSMIAGTPPEIGTNEARLANPGPEFHWYNLLLLATRLAAAPSCNDQISSVSGPMPESAPISPCREDSFCFDYGSPSTSRPTRPTIWGLTASNSTSRHYGPFQRPVGSSSKIHCQTPPTRPVAMLTAMSGVAISHVGGVSRSRLHSRRNTAKICTDIAQSELDLM
jgi:hypothetical protein